MDGRRTIRFAVVLALGFMTITPARAADACLDFDQSARVTFEGRLTHTIFPGPPNYENVKTGDRPEPTYILQLLKPVCASGLDEKINRVQIFPANGTDQQSIWAKLKGLIGRRVVVSGSSPFAALTGHHHAPLLLPIIEVKRARAIER